MRRKYDIGDTVRLHWPRWIAGTYKVLHVYQDWDKTWRLQVSGYDGPHSAPNVTLVARAGAPAAQE